MFVQCLRRWRIPLGAAFVVLALLYGGISVFLANGVTKADREAFDETPTEYGLSYEDVEFSSRGGAITLKGWHIPTTGNAPTIIFAHGLGSTRAGDNAVGLAARLWAEGFNTLLFDLRGHGTSGDGKVSGGYFEQKDLLGAYDYLVGQGVPNDTIGVIGFSMGAAAAVLGISNETKIRALVVDTTFASASDLIVQEVARRTPVPKWMVPLFGPGTKFAANAIHGIKLGDIDPESAVTNIDYPILLIHGLEDTRIPVEQSIRVHAASHQASSIWLVPDTDHVDAFLNFPDEYTERVIAYFRGRFGTPQ